MLHRYRLLVVVSLLMSAAPGVPAAPAAEGLPAEVLQEVRAPQSLPAGRYSLQRAWEAEGQEAGHNLGARVTDADASGGAAWELKGATGALSTAYHPGPAPDAPAGSTGTPLFGPYIEVPPGSYVAFFRIKLLEDAGEEPVGDVDACVGYGRESLAVQPLAGGDLAVGRYVQVPLAFRYNGGKLECRLSWRGFHSLRVDRISLFRVEGPNVDIKSGRAPQPTPTGKPNGLPYRGPATPAADLFPHSQPPAAELLVADLRRLPPDWQLCLLTLQGLTNRQTPSMYSITVAQDVQWLDWMLQRQFVRSTRTLERPEDWLDHYRALVKGVVISDPRLPATKNVAMMVASVQDGIVVSPRLAQQLRLPVLMDLRGKWKTNVEAYRWAFDTLWPRLSHKMIACLWPDSLGIRDYLAQQKVFTFWLSGPIDGARKGADPQAEVKLMEELLAKMPVNIPVLGYPWAGKDVGIGEGPGVQLFAEFGKYLVGSVDSTNLSVHSGIQAPAPRRQVPPAPPLQRDKVYLSIIISDGDNLPVLTLHNFPQLWKDPLRGKFPIGWTISPSSRLLIPDVVDYYYRTATPDDCFLGAVSGVGYTYPDHYGERFAQPGRVFDGFLEQTRQAMAGMDLKDAWIMGITRPELIRRYAERIPGLESIYPDYGRRVSTYDEATYPTVHGVPVFHAATGWTEGAPREKQVADVVAQIKAMAPAGRPAFLHLFVWNWGFNLPMLKEILDKLGPDYVAVRPDHLAQLYKQYLAEKKVLVRAPALITGIEGQRLSWTASLYNATGKPMALKTQPAGGMAGATIRPAQARIASDASATVTVSGMPSGDTIRLEVSGAFGRRETTFPCRVVSAKELAGALPKGVSLEFARHYEAELLSHRSGKEERDPTATGGSAWCATPGETEPGYILFGPYAPLPAGHYVALFRLKRTGEGKGILATIDTCVGGGKVGTALREVRAEELPIGEYRSFPLELKHPGGTIETRVQWTGAAPLLVDSVTIWKVVK